MTKLVAEFDREFKMWNYTVGHSELLLRSVKGSRHKTQIDVVFFAVQTINIPSTFHRLRIEKAEDAKKAVSTVCLGSTEASVELPPELPGQKWHRIRLFDDWSFFNVSGDGWDGHIVAAGVNWIENNSDYGMKSELMSGRWIIDP